MKTANSTACEISKIKTIDSKGLLHITNPLIYIAKLYRLKNHHQQNQLLYGFDGLSVEVAASFGVEDDDGTNALVESLHPVIGGGDVFAESGGGGSISIL